MIIKKHQNKEHLDSLVIGSGHSIMAGYIPPSIPKEEFSQNFYQWTKSNPESISRFGFWGSDIDYNTYYPNLPKEELTPNDEEFIEPMFRLLSATIVSKNWNPTDFSQNGVLKASMKMLLGQTVNCDHETNIGNAIGAVSKVVWQDEYKDGSFTIPAGINGVLKIDGKANPRIARGILMEPPSIHSNSVTIQFKWDKSHPELSDEEFYTKLGTYDSKGNMVRRMVTEVVRYLETSLVSHGADTFAQKIGSDGKIVNPEFAKRTWSSYEEYNNDKAKQFFFSDYKTVNYSNASFNDTPANNNNQDNVNNVTNMNELELFIQAITGKGMIQLAEGVEATKENVISALKAVLAENTSLKATAALISTKDEQITNLTTQVANLKEMSEMGKSFIASLREEVVSNYQKLKGDSADETILTMLKADTTGVNTLKSLNKDYKAQLEEKFPMTCSKCGSHDISRASSAKEPEPKVDTNKNQEPSGDIFSEVYRQKLNPKK